MAPRAASSVGTARVHLDADVIGERTPETKRKNENEARRSESNNAVQNKTKKGKLMEKNRERRERKKGKERMKLLERCRSRNFHAIQYLSLVNLRAFL